MKKLFFILLASMIAFTGVAQITHTSQGNVDKHAQEILKKASSAFSSKPVSCIVTMVSRDAHKKESARQDVQVLYHKGKYHITSHDQELYCDGTSVWHWQKEVNEVVVSKMVQSDDDLMNPGRLLMNYSKNFRPKYIRTEEDGTAIVDLQPIKSKSYHKIRLFITEKTGVIKRMEMHNYDGSQGEFHVANFRVGAKCADKDFIFDHATHKGVEVIDMR